MLNALAAVGALAGNLCGLPFLLAQTGQGESAPADTPVAPPPQPVAPPEAFSPVLLWLMALGIILLLVWIVRRIARPRKLLLLDAPGRPNKLEPFHALGIFVVYMAAALGLTQVFDTRIESQLIVHNAIAQTVLLAACLAVAGLTFRFGIVRGLGLSLRRWKIDLLRGVMAYLAVLPVCVLLVLAANAISGETDEHPILQSLAEGSLPVGLRVLAVIVTVVLAPLAEEAFFRGIVQTTLRNLLRSPWAAILLSSVLFMIVHGTGLLLHWPTLLALSMTMGYNYERTGRLTPSVLIHALFNGVFTALAMAGAG